MGPWHLGARYDGDPAELDVEVPQQPCAPARTYFFRSFSQFCSAVSVFVTCLLGLRLW